MKSSLARMVVKAVEGSAYLCSTLRTLWTFHTLGFLFSVSISSSVFLASLERYWEKAWTKLINKYNAK